MMIMPSARNASVGVAVVPSAAAIALIDVEPVAPNASAMPYRKNAVANDPRRKYLTDDSTPVALPLRKPARM